MIFNIGSGWKQILLLAACLLAELPLTAQLSSVREKADSLYEAARWGEASHEYKRYLFYQAQSTESKSMERLAECYFRLGNYTQSRVWVERALDKRKAPELQFRSAMLAYLDGYEKEALISLDQLAKTNPGPEWRQPEMLLRSLCFNVMGEYKSARAVLATALKDQPEEQQKLDSLYRKALKFKPKKRNVAFLLSVVLPGSGQIYAGKPVDGVISFILTGGTATLGVYSFIQGYYAFTFLTCLTFLQKFYEGGSRYARKLARQYNLDKQAAFAKELNQWLLARYRP